MPYKIPKDRFRVKTIKMKNGVLVGEADDQGNMYWFKDGKYITPSQMKTYSYYDSSIKAYRSLGDKADFQVNAGVVDIKGVHNPVYTPSLNQIRAKNIESGYAYSEKEHQQAIPLDNQDWLTLRTKGKMNLVDIPINMLDSIAVNAGRSGTDFWTDAALIGKESTFGGYSHYLGSPHEEGKGYVMPVHDLANNHAYAQTPESDYLMASYRKYDHRDEAQVVAAENDAKYALQHGLKVQTPHYSDYFLADAFKRYQVAPAQYNPGQGNYVPMLNGIKAELQGEKQLQNYWNTRGKQEYARGQQEGMAYGGSLRGKSWDDLSMAEKFEVMKIAIQGGITNLDTIRAGFDEFSKGGSIHIDPSKKGTFTAAASRHSMGVQEFASKVLANKDDYSPAMVKKANFARNVKKFKHGDGGNLYEIGGNKPVTTGGAGYVPDNYGWGLVNLLRKIGVMSEPEQEKQQREAERKAAELSRQTREIPATYIGGTPSETRKEYWRQEPVMQHAVDSIAGEYGISPDLLKYRLNREGFVDRQIEKRNLDTKQGREPIRGYDLLNFPTYKTSPQAGFMQFGLDDAKTYIDEGKVNLINEQWYEGTGTNEKGRPVNFVTGVKLKDNLGISAAMLKYFRDTAKKDYPDLSESELDRYAAAYYNRGIEGGRKWAKNGAKGYKIK